MNYFTISELIHSNNAISKKIWNGANREQEDNLVALVVALLDPLREAYGKPIRIKSGFRCPAVNKLVGGVYNSQHLKGEAADIDTGRKSENKLLAKLIVDLNLPFDQLIDEDDYSWVHVSFKRVGDNRGQILRKRNGKYTSIRRDDL